MNQLFSVSFRNKKSTCIKLEAFFPFDKFVVGSFGLGKFSQILNDEIGVKQ